MMAVAKSILIGLTVLLGIGALALGVLGGLSLSAAGPQPPVTVLEVSLRPFPTARGATPQVAVADGGPTADPAPDAGAAAPVVAIDAGAPVAPPAPPPPAARPDAGAPAAVVRPPAPPAGEGSVNLRASDTADVFVDGKKVGGSPIEGLKVRAGTHKVRFDCYDAAGNTVPGATKSITVAADAEESLEYTCPVE